MFDPAGVSPESDEWYTPSWLFRALRVEFDLDPCSPGAPPSSVPDGDKMAEALLRSDLLGVRATIWSAQ